MQCEMNEERCECEKYCCNCQSQIDVRLCQDGLYYCVPCREACDYKVSG
jgi:sulfur transfer complex TusBCD TusB component (DsrH family)